MLIGYVRVSKSDGTQTLAPQRDAMLAAGVDPTRIYEDLASGRRDDRPGLAACLKAIQPGNTLVLWKLDRLGRDLRHLVNTVDHHHAVCLRQRRRDAEGGGTSGARRHTPAWHGSQGADPARTRPPPRSRRRLMPKGVAVPAEALATPPPPCGAAAPACRAHGADGVHGPALRGHRSEPHSRIDDWLAHLPADGVQQMCAWERFCAFAREPERRRVGIDCRVTVAGVAYEVDAELAGETVVLWWGLFDQEIWAEHGEERYGPFLPVGGPIPLHRYRKHRKSRREVRADQVGALAGKLALPRAALSGEDGVVMVGAGPDARAAKVPVRPFRDPDPFHELGFASPIAARRAIAEEVRLPLAKLSDDDRAFIDALLARTMARPEILAAVRERFPLGRRKGTG